MTAVALGEGGGSTTIFGDTTIQTPKWGPSVGTWQIRTLKQPGNDWSRDLGQLSGNAVRQAQAAKQISNGGRNLRPWSAYTKGWYHRHLPRATAAVDEICN